MFQETPGTPEDVDGWTEYIEFVEDSGEEVVVRYEAGAEDVRSTGRDAPKDPAEEEAASARLMRKR